MQNPNHNLRRENEFSIASCKVLGASFVGMALSPGPVFLGSLGVLIEPFERDLGWSRGGIMFTMTLMTAAMILTSSPTGNLIDKFGVRRILLLSVSLLFGSLSLLALGFSNLYYFYTILFLTGALTVGSQSIAYTRLLASWFSSNYGMAVGIAASGIGFGYAVIPKIVHLAIDSHSWRFSYQVMAALVLVNTVFLYLFAHTKPYKEVASQDSELSYGLTLRETLQTRTLWLIAVIIGLFSCTLTGLLPHIVSIGKAAGITTSEAVFLASMFGLTTFVSRLLVGFFLDRFFAPYVALCCFSLSTIGLILFTYSTTFQILILASILTGAGFGAESDLIGYFIRRYFGLKAFGKIYGVILGAFLVGAGIGPVLLGSVYGWLGGYREILHALILASVVGCALLLGMHPYPQYTDNQASNKTLN